MSYVDIKTIHRANLTIEVIATEMFTVGEIYPLSFEGQPEIDGSWKVLKIEPGISVELERSQIKVYSSWAPGVTSVDYKRKAP